MEFLTAGESHGKALIGIINDFPSGVSISKDKIDMDLFRRQKGFGRGKRMQIEKDKVEIISGLRKGISIGSPISFIIKNKDWVSWSDSMSAFPKKNENLNDDIVENPRPGHADLTGVLKYRFNDIRNVIERSSARETAARVAAGSFAKQFLKYFDIEIYSFVLSIGKIRLKDEYIKNKELKADIFIRSDSSDLRCPDEKTTNEMKKEIERAIEDKDTLGGSFVLYIKNLPYGLGSYIQWNKRIDAILSFYLMSIPSVKAVEIGDAIKGSSSRGTMFHDEIFYSSDKRFFRETNNAGGIEGGMTNGQDVIITAYLKPIPTTMKGLKTINIRDKSPQISTKERSDFCAVPSASIVGEAMAAMAIMSAVQDKFGKDNIDEILQNYNNYLKYIDNI